MKKQLLKQLVLASYKNNELNKDIVMKIADRLDRKEFKMYLKALKNAEKLRTVFIETPFSDKKELEDIKSLFPDKKILVKFSPSFLVGTKITYDDNVFEMSLKNSLDAIIDHIEKDYD